MRRPAVQRAVKAALTSHGFSYTLNAPYEKAAPRYRNRPHSHSFLTRPFLSSCSISISKCCLANCAGLRGQAVLHQEQPWQAWLP